MQNIDYTGLIKKAWEITWKNRFLWWFGLFLALAGGSGSLNNLKRISDKEKPSNIQQQAVLNFIEAHLSWIIAAAILIVMIYLGFVIASIIARAGLIGSLEKILLDKPAGFKPGMVEGKKYFWRIVGMKILLSLFVLFSIIVLAAPVMFLFYYQDYIGAIILGIIAFLILIGLSILSAFLNNFGQLYIVLGNLSIMAAVENSYALLRKNLSNSLILLLFFIPLGIVVFCAYIAAAMIIGIPFAIIGLVLYLILKDVGMIIGAAIGIAVIILALLLIQSIFEVFSQAIWLLYFYEIAKKKKEEPATEDGIIAEQKNHQLPDTDPVIRIKTGENPENESQN